jgi:cysteine desulfurase
MIYADNASTTKISEFVLAKMLPFLQEQYGNASNLYSFGVKAKRAVEQSRKQVAVAIDAEPYEIVFTSGGSEGNSWVLHSIAALCNEQSIHVITSPIEHPSVINACHAFEQRGVSVTYLPVNGDGIVSVIDVEAALRPDTKLVSIMLANNEIGTIQPMAEIGKLLSGRGILFHTDAVQAVGHIPVNVNDLQIDFLTASAHKFNGAKGAGFIYIRSGLILPNMIFGGKQEHGKRAGTENVAGIVALGAALEESVAIMTDEGEKKNALVQETITGLRTGISGTKFNGENAERLPGILNITFPDVSGEAIMHLLDLKGICVSTGSACYSGKDEPSHVLLALGLTEQQAKSSMRISYGRYNNKEDAKQIVSAICEAYEKITATKLAGRNE